MNEILVHTLIGPVRVGDRIYFERRFAHGWVIVKSIGNIGLRGGRRRVWLNVIDRNGWCRAVRLHEVVRIGLL